MQVHEGGRYRRRDGVNSSRVIKDSVRGDSFLIAWEDGKEFVYLESGALFNPAKNVVINYSDMDVVEEYVPKETVEGKEPTTKDLIGSLKGNQMSDKAKFTIEFEILKSMTITQAEQRKYILDSLKSVQRDLEDPTHGSHGVIKNGNFKIGTYSYTHKTC